MRRIVGAALLAGGVILFIHGMNATDSLADRFNDFFTEHFTDATTLHIVGGIALAVGGLLLLAFGGRTALRH